jgi:hypothetical protein
MAFDYTQTINGNYGQVWLNGDLVGEATSLECKVTNVKADVKVLGDPWKHSKVMGYEGKGTLKLNKISDRIWLTMQSNFATGLQTPCSIYATLSDPASNGATRVNIEDVIFDEFTVINFEVDKLLEEDVPFTFAGFSYIDTIAPPTNN